MNQNSPELSRAFEVPRHLKLRRAIGAMYLKSLNRRYIVLPEGEKVHERVTAICSRECDNSDGSFLVHVFGVAHAEALVGNPERLLDDAYCQIVWQYFYEEADRQDRLHRFTRFNQSQRFAFYERLLVSKSGNVELDFCEVGGGGWAGYGRR